MENEEQNKAPESEQAQLPATTPKKEGPQVETLPKRARKRKKLASKNKGGAPGVQWT